MKIAAGLCRLASPIQVEAFVFVDKLKLQPLHLLDVPLRQHPGVVGMSAFLPESGQQALAFGWASTNGSPLQPLRYWIWQFGPEGASHQWLPEGLSQHYAERVGWSGGTSSCNQYMHAFRSGQSLGLLLGLHEVQLLDPDTGSLSVIPIEGLPADAPWVPLHLGQGLGAQVPVIMMGPNYDYFEGCYLALLHVDPKAGQARWQGLTNGQPSMLDKTDYAPLMAGPWTPRIYSMASHGDDWWCYVGPKHTVHHRNGMPPSALGLHGPDFRLKQVVHQASEDSFGRLTRCGDWLILNPYRKSGPRKGRQTLVNLQDGRVLEPAPPRGHAGWQVVDHFADCWWLLPMGLQYGAQQVLACTAK